jgi:hypothetical protein
MLTFYVPEGEDWRYTNDGARTEPWEIVWQHIRADRSRLFYAGQLTVLKMKRELEEVFGIATAVWSDTGSPGLGRSVYLRVLPDQAPRGEPSAYMQAVRQASARRNLPAGTTEDAIEAGAQESIRLWHTARNRLIEEIRIGRDIKLCTCLLQHLFFGAQNTISDELYGIWSPRHHVRWTTEILMNPFSWFVFDIRARTWVLAMEGSSSPALNTFGPAMLFLHEHIHAEGCMFPERDLDRMHEQYPDDPTPADHIVTGERGPRCYENEQRVADDVDDAIRDHIGVLMRLRYHDMETYQKYDRARGVYVDAQRERDTLQYRRWYVGALHSPQFVDAGLDPEEGLEWVLIPTPKELASGERE